jgi:hypothetical protein
MKKLNVVLLYLTENSILNSIILKGVVPMLALIAGTQFLSKLRNLG